jgi:hypothetical protein
MGRYVNLEPPEYDTLAFNVRLLWPSTKRLIPDLLTSTGEAIARFPRTINTKPDLTDCLKRSLTGSYTRVCTHIVCGSFSGAESC